jgi:SWI/SNF-related matrix-associated actin-dependent regulator 1 of chromatin subfamily A
MVRRRSREVLDLPPKERKRILIPIPVSEDMQKKFARWKRINRLEITQKLERERKLLITQLYVLSGKAKIPKLIQHLKGVKEPFLVFAVHTEVLETMQKEFPQSAVLHGGIPALKREEVVQQFQGGHLQSLFLSIGACSTGLTITRARLLFFAEYSFSPGDLEQAENRIWRIGQTQPCTISYLHSPPFDDWIWKSLQRKSENTL